jgi:hypothetical protein
MRNPSIRNSVPPATSGTQTTWIEQLNGVLGRVHLHRLAARLHGLPSSTRIVRIDWGRVSHIDFRSFAEVAEELRRLHRRGVNVQCLGFDSYLLAIVLFSFSVEEVELFAGSSVQLPAGEVSSGIDGLIRRLSPLEVSKN